MSLLAGCPSSAFDGPVGTGPSRTSGFTSAGGSSGSAGGNSLDGPLAFTPAASSAFRNGGQFIVVMTDQSIACDRTGASAQQVQLEVALVDGGLPGLGTYAIDGVHVQAARLSPMATLAVAASGSVTLNRLDDTVLGGNFIGAFVPPDGGASSSLSGIFGASRCP